jgi:hypothetical protein
MFENSNVTQHKGGLQGVKNAKVRQHGTCVCVCVCVCKAGAQRMVNGVDEARVAAAQRRVGLSKGRARGANECARVAESVTVGRVRGESSKTMVTTGEESARS